MGGCVTRVRALILFLISVGLLIVGKGGLDVATATIQRGMFCVPDLMGIEVARSGGASYLELLRYHPEVAGFYLRTLWTYDVLFPIGLCGVCFTLIAGGPLPRAFRWLPLLVLAADLGAENVTVTLALRASVSQAALWGTAWQWATVCKWVLTYVTIPCAGSSAVWMCGVAAWTTSCVAARVARFLFGKAAILLRAMRQRLLSVAVRVKT